MNYRTATLLARETKEGSGTKTIDVNVKDSISRILIKWDITKLTPGMQSYCYKDITKIELVDGSDVLHSLDGGLNQALCIFDRKAPSMNFGTYIMNNPQLSMYGIDFGRFLHDPMLALDPKQFNNLQLKISYDSDVSDTGVEEGNLAVFLELFDEKIVSPIGFLSAKEIYNTTPPATSAYKYIDLPTDRMIRRMIIQGYMKAYQPWYSVSEVRLDEDNDKRVLFDWDTEDYYKFRQSIDPKVRDTVQFHSAMSEQDLYLTPTDYWASLIAICGTQGTLYGIGETGKGGFFEITANAGLAARGHAEGWLPNHCFNFPFGDDQDIDDWYDVTKVGNLRARLRTGSLQTGATQAVVLQQLRRY